MTPTDEQPDWPANQPQTTLSALAEQDAVVQAFRDFVSCELAKRDQENLPEVVAEFSRRLTFVTKYVPVTAQTDNLASMILQLTDAKMAEIALGAVDSDEGRDRLSRYLQSQPYPHYEPNPANPELIFRIKEDGSRVSGRFVNEKFVAVNDE